MTVQPSILKNLKICLLMLWCISKGKNVSFHQDFEFSKHFCKPQTANQASQSMTSA